MPRICRGALAHLGLHGDLRCIANNLSFQSCMIDSNATFGQYLLKVTIGDWIADIKENSVQDNTCGNRALLKSTIFNIPSPVLRSSHTVSYLTRDENFTTLLLLGNDRIATPYLGCLDVLENLQGLLMKRERGDSHLCPIRPHSRCTHHSPNLFSNTRKL